MISLLRRNRDFRLLFLAQIVSYAGDWFATVAVLGLVRERTQNDLYATLVFVSQSLPAFFLSPLAGPVADRANRKTVLTVVSVIQIGCALLFLGALHGPVGLVFVAQGSISAFGAFFGPASQASIPNLVDEADLPDATSLIGATWGTMVAVGAGLGAVFTSIFGRTASFIADAVSFAIAAVLIASIRRPLSARAAANRPKMRPIADTVEGLRYARGNRTVTALLMSKAGFGMASGMVGLLAVLADVRFHQRERGAGFLLACRGIGVVAGPFLARRFTRGSIERVLLICGLSALLSGAMYSIVPWSPSRGRWCSWHISAAARSGRCRRTACRSRRPIICAAASSPPTSR